MLAWNIAALSRTSELPPLDVLLEAGSAEPTPEEEMNAFRALRAQLAPIIERKPE